jgi:transcriptional regulator with XRE-family HTH domain
VKNRSFNHLFAQILQLHFGGSSKLLAEKTGLDAALVSRVLNSERKPTPQFVGRLARVLAKQEAESIIQSYLQGVAAEVAVHQLASVRAQKRTPAKVASVYA